MPIDITTTPGRGHGGRRPVPPAPARVSPRTGPTASAGGDAGGTPPVAGHRRPPPLVRVLAPGPAAPDELARLLGEPRVPLPASVCFPSPALLVAGRFHDPTTYYLRHKAQGKDNLSTLVKDAGILGEWLTFLHRERGLPLTGDHNDAVFAAVEQDFAAFWKRRHMDEDGDRCSSSVWQSTRRVMKGFYEYLQARVRKTPPFEIAKCGKPGAWSGTMIVGYHSRVRRTGSAGRPLTPAWLEYLLMGALRLDLDGRQDDYTGAQRDHALISLAAGTGLRRNNLAHLTVYEVPRPWAVPFTAFAVPHAVTKNGAGGDAWAFSHRLRAVHDYINEDRSAHAARRPWTPYRPLHIVEADGLRVRWADPFRGGEVSDARWYECDSSTRLRLVSPDGSSPLLFLGDTGQPYGYGSFKHPVAEAARFARARIAGADLSVGLRLHDLRHTYAVHLSVCMHLGVLAAHLPAARAARWKSDTVASAVGIVAGSMGHVSEASTRLYTSATSMFLNIPAGDFIGDAL